jgi:BirA family biotin operon repressor/biotin-[acetyl-CoA-carboxylase] ligase
LPSDLQPPALIEALDRVKSRLGVLESVVHYFESTSSTNDQALALAREGVVVLADAQTAGRGRRGHVWFSPSGSGLYVSVVLAPARARVDPERATKLVTLMAGLAVAEGIEAATGLRAEVKWPNDLYRGVRKLGGILAEASASPARLVVVGYGVNVLPAAYPPELRSRATSLESELGHPIERFWVLSETLVAVAARYADLLDGKYDAILDAWRGRAPTATGASVAWATPLGTMSGTTSGIDEDGALLVRTDAGLERIVAGELQWDFR